MCVVMCACEWEATWPTECNTYSVLCSGLPLDHYESSLQAIPGAHALHVPSSVSPEAHTFPATHTGSTTNLTLKALNTEAGT